MGRLGIPVWCYEWMTDFNWVRTNMSTPSRGGSVVTSFDYNDVPENLTDRPPISEEELWVNLEYFLKKVLPVAEKANVKLSMHPDDPPLSPIRGVGRIMRSIENYQRLIEMVPSPMNTITLCQGNFTLMTDDLPAAHPEIRQENLLRPFPRCERRSLEVRGDLARRRQDRHARLHARLSRTSASTASCVPTTFRP